MKLKTTGFQLEALRKLFTKNGKILRAGEQTGSSDIEFVDSLIHNFGLITLRGFEIYDKMPNMPMSKEVHIYRCPYQLSKKKFDNQLIYYILFANLHISSIWIITFKKVNIANHCCLNSWNNAAEDQNNQYGFVQVSKFLIKIVLLSCVLNKIHYILNFSGKVVLLPLWKWAGILV